MLIFQKVIKSSSSRVQVWAMIKLYSWPPGQRSLPAQPSFFNITPQRIAFNYYKRIDKMKVLYSVHQTFESLKNSYLCAFYRRK